MTAAQHRERDSRAEGCSRRAVLGAALAASALAWTGAAAADTAIRCTPRLIVRGMSLPSWWTGTYRSARYGQSLASLRELGFNAAAVIPTHFVAATGDSRIIDGQQTESFENVAAAVEKARDEGFQVLLKPHLNVTGYAAPAQTIDPIDKRAFFAAYQALVGRYASLAESTGASFLAVGGELSRLTGPEFREPWLAVIDEARRAFRGPLVYAANWGEDLNVSFWDALDYIGIDMYAPMQVTQPASAETIIDRWVNAPAAPDTTGVYGRTAYIDLFRSLSAQHRKPVLFTEVGVRSVTGALSAPWDFTHSYAAADFALQTSFYQALMKLVCENNDGWLAGMFLWGWRFDAAPTGEAWATDYSIENKPAAAIVRRYLRT